MRGTIYYQTSVLIKEVFAQGAKKTQRVDKVHEHYQCVASYNTAQTYRKVWNDLGRFLKEEGIKDFQAISQKQIIDYMQTKILQGVSHQHLQKISSAIGKLEIALNRIAIRFEQERCYDFSERIKIVKVAKKQQLSADNYRDRAYSDPTSLIFLLDDEKFKVAASIQLAGGARSEGVTLIKRSQLKGLQTDLVTQKGIGVIMTKEKGGKTGEVMVDEATYNVLEYIIDEEGIFKIDYRRYTEALQNACRIMGVKSEGSHGLRWNFAQERIIEYQDAGYSYGDALQMVSYEMKHLRPDITCHYVGK